MSGIGLQCKSVKYTAFEEMRQASKETAILKELDYPSIPRVYEESYQPKYVLFLSEMVEGQILRSWIGSYNAIFRQIELYSDLSANP